MTCRFEHKFGDESPPSRRPTPSDRPVASTLRRGSMADAPVREWHKVADLDELPEGRVKTALAGHRAIALTHFEGRYGAIDNRCPHQGGPLGEGSIEKGLLRCPWHGYDYDPHDGHPPAGFSDAPACFPCEVRDDGVY